MSRGKNHPWDGTVLGQRFDYFVEVKSKNSDKVYRVNPYLEHCSCINFQMRKFINEGTRTRLCKHLSSVIEDISKETWKTPTI